MSKMTWHEAGELIDTVVERQLRASGWKTASYRDREIHAFKDGHQVTLSVGGTFLDADVYLRGDGMEIRAKPDEVEDALDAVVAWVTREKAQQDAEIPSPGMSDIAIPGKGFWG